MKKTFMAMLVILLVGVWSAGSVLAAFPDVAGNHPHIQGINYGQANGLFEGYPDGTFKPDNPVNRAEFTKIVLNAIFPDQATGSNCFPDVVEEWFAPFVCFAKDKNILEGYPNGTFKPINNIKFAEGSKVIVNTFGFEVNTEDPVWYKPFVEELGVRRAIPTTITDFGQLMTRGEMAEIVYRLSEKITDKPSRTYEGIESGEPYDPYVWYENQDLGFKAKHHETWQNAEDDVSAIPIAYMISPASEEGDFRELVSVIAEDLSATPMNLEEYTNNAVTQFGQLFPEFNQLSLTNTSLGGDSAKKIVYTFAVEGAVFKNMQIWTIIGDKAYVVSYNAFENSYDTFENEAEDIINSFEFL